MCRCKTGWCSVSRQPTDHRIAASPDLRRLFDEGYVLEIRDSHLLVHQVPHVASPGVVRQGILIAPITFAGDKAAPPASHVAQWIGAHPCLADGQKLEAIQHAGAAQLGPSLAVDFSFSAKPTWRANGRYVDFHEKITAYVTRIVAEAQGIDPTVRATTFGLVESADEAEVFRYTESASAHVGIGDLAARLAVDKIAIVGLGGTGGYLLDFVAKTSVREIHLWDPDVFLNHNAFRAPGAATIEELRAQLPKVEYFARRYSGMRRGVIAHHEAIDDKTVASLRDMHTVFVCVDRGTARRFIVDALRETAVHCIIVGMGLYRSANGIGGQIATTTAIPGRWAHLEDRVSFGDRDEEDAYAQNIQLADLNALNAVMAVQRWKQLCGFYADFASAGHLSYLLETAGLVVADPLGDARHANSPSDRTEGDADVASGDGTAAPSERQGDL